MAWDGFSLETEMHAPRNDATPAPRVELRQNKRWRAQAAMRELLADKAPWLLEGRSAPADAAKVIKQLIEGTESMRDADTRRLARNFLIRGVAIGNQQKRWVLPVLSQTLRAPLPKPPIALANFGDLARIGKMREAFLLAMRDEGALSLHKLSVIRKFKNRKHPITEHDLRVGPVLLSAIIFGGITLTPRLKALAQAGRACFGCHGSVGWMEWQEAPLDASLPGRWQRWYPEAISGLLFAKAHRDGLLPLIPGSVAAALLTPAIWKPIEAVLALLPLDPTDRPGSLSQLIKACNTWMSYQLPPFLSGYACGRNDSTSVPPLAHLRMITGLASRVDASVMPTTNVEINLPQYAPTPQFTPVNRADRTRLQAQLRAMLRGNSSKATLIGRLDAYLANPELSASLFRLAQWVRHLVKNRTRGQTRIKVSSIHKYLVYIDKGLVSALEERDPMALEQADLAELYAEILDSMKPKAAAGATIALVKFHHYLASFNGVAAQVDGVFEGRSVGGSVDANQITPKEYDAAMALLDPGQSGEPSWLATMQQMALMLGFRTLLRRGEVRRLRMGDILGEVMGVVYIRSTDKGTVKSPSARRNISLRGHLTVDEQATFSAFLKSRLREISGQNDLSGILYVSQKEYKKVGERPLFEHPERVGELIPERKLFDPIVTALLETSHDPSVHYHLARKGGVCWMLLALAEDELPGCSLFFDPSGAIQRASSALRLKMLQTNGPDRRLLWALSTFAGHASPATTVGSYIHCLDWLLSFALQMRSPKLDTPLVAAMTGLTQNHVRVVRSGKHIKEDDYLFWVGYNHASWRASIQPSLPAHPENDLLARPKSARPPMQGCDVLELIKKVIVDKIDVQQLGEKFDISSSKAIRWTQRAQALLANAPPDSADAAGPAADGAQTARGGSHGIHIDQSISILRTPRQTAERALLNQWTAAMHQWALSEPVMAAQWLSTFWRGFDDRTNGITFTDIVTARSFVSTLVAIAPSPMPVRLVYRLAPLINKASVPRQTQLTAWADGLTLALDDIVIDRHLSRQTEGALGRLTVLMAHEHQVTKETQKKHARCAVPRRTWLKTSSRSLVGACYVVTLWMLEGMYTARLP